MGQEYFSIQRQKMVKYQLEGRGIHDQAVLKAISEVPREEFVPVNLIAYAYEDRPLPIAEEQTISQPYIVALMLEALELKPSDRILDIGTGSGYAAAVASRIVSHVYGIEYFSSLVSQAQNVFKNLEYNNITVKAGDGSIGWKEHAPFQAIAVAAGSEQIPKALLEQLDSGGKLIMPVGLSNAYQELIKVTKTDSNSFTYERLSIVRFVPLL